MTHSYIIKYHEKFSNASIKECMTPRPLSLSFILFFPTSNFERYCTLLPSVQKLPKNFMTHGTVLGLGKNLGF